MQCYCLSLKTYLNFRSDYGNYFWQLTVAQVCGLHQQGLLQMVLAYTKAPGHYAVWGLPCSFPQRKAWFSLLTVAMIKERKKKNMTQSILSKESVYFSSHFQVKAYHFGDPRQETKQGLEAETKEEHVAGLLPGPCSASFLIYSKTTCLGIVLPTVSWAIPHWSSVKTVCHRYGLRPIRSGQFLNWDFHQWL